MVNDENTVKTILVLGKQQIRCIEDAKTVFEYKRHFGFKAKIVRVEKQKMIEVEALDIFKKTKKIITKKF